MRAPLLACSHERQQGRGDTAGLEATCNASSVGPEAARYACKFPPGLDAQCAAALRYGRAVL